VPGLVLGSESSVGNGAGTGLGVGLGIVGVPPGELRRDSSISAVFRDNCQPPPLAGVNSIGNVNAPVFGRAVLTLIVAITLDGFLSDHTRLVAGEGHRQVAAVAQRVAENLSKLPTVSGVSRLR